MYIYIYELLNCTKKQYCYQIIAQNNSEEPLGGILVSRTRPGFCLLGTKASPTEAPKRIYPVRTCSRGLITRLNGEPQTDNCPSFCPQHRISGPNLGLVCG
jgi:hypothetical protein